MAKLLAIGMVAIVGVGSSEAHWSASQGRSLYTHRYLICDGKPETRVHCAGPIRARGTLMADLAGKDESKSYAAAVDAVYFNVRDAIPVLKRHLVLRVETGERKTRAEIDKNGRRAQAAYALAQFGDRESAAAIRDLLVEFETHGHGFLWRDTLSALAALDPVMASRYALEFYGRAKDFKMSLPGGSGKLDALDYIRREDAAVALPLMEKLAKQEERGYDHAHCEFMATRVRLDDALRAKVRTMFVGSYSGTWLPLCAESVFKRMTEAQPDDAAAFVRHLGRDDNGMDYGMANLAYQRIGDLLAIHRTSNAPAVQRARDVIRRGLVERNQWPHVADPKHRNYSLHFVVLHQAVLAALGDAGARAKLYAILDDPKDKGDAWLAALWAIRLELPDAQDKVGALLARAGRQDQDHHRGLFSEIRRRVLTAFATRHPDDPRWTTMLLDLERKAAGGMSDAAELAVYRVSRHAPKGTCEAVVGAAHKANTMAAEHAFLALSALGDRCRGELAKLADDVTASGEARGAALELLGVLGDPMLAERIRRAERDGAWKPAVDRARRWVR